MDDPSRSELGDLLRSRRAKLRPETVGLAAGRRRRAHGLRREEVAELAGIGVDWYTRLEQGRAVAPSPTTVDALARALRLTKAEHAHLKALAQTAGRRPFAPETAPPALRAVVERLTEPAYVTGRRSDVLAWNAAADAVFGFSGLAEAERNILLLMLTREEGRMLFGDSWATEARRMVAQFRATHDFWASDPAFVALLDALKRGCPEFPAWWADHDIRAGGTGRKRLLHPEMGILDFDYAAFQSNDDPALKLTIYTPAAP